MLLLHQRMVNIFHCLYYIFYNKNIVRYLEIKKLYGNYSDNERKKIAQNQRKEKERKFLFSRRSRGGDNVWQNSNFSDEFMSGSKRRLFKNDDYDEMNMPHTFDELYKHYDQQKRLIQQKQNKMKRMKDKLYWFRKNSTSSNNLKISEKKPLMKMNKNELKQQQQLFPSKSLKETENNLLNKAAQILLGNGNDTRTSSTKDYDIVCRNSPDSLQEKILNIASDGDQEEEEEEENRLPTFV